MPSDVHRPAFPSDQDLAAMAGARLLASDVDGTLDGADHQLSARTGAALRAAEDAGMAVALVTGRAGPSATANMDGAGITGHLVAFGGALVVRRSDHAVLKKVTMDPAEAAAAAEFGRRHDLHVAFFTTDGVHAERRGPAYDFLRATNPGESVFLERPGTFDPAEHEMVKVQWSAEPAVFDALTPTVRAEFPRMQRSLPQWFEMNAPGASKWDGLQVVLDDIGATAAQVVGIGDGENDLSWLAEIAWPLAVANACDAVHALARGVLPANTDDGVAVLVEELLRRR